MKLYFYSDAKEWGGQEILSARIASVLSDRGFEVLFFFFNAQFNNALANSVRRIPIPFCASTPYPIFRDKNPLKISKIKKLFQKEHVETLIICPGNIERCLPAVYAADKLKIKIISYYPLAFSQKESGASLGSVRDFLAQKIYPKISSWIVNTEYQKKLLQRFISKNTPIEILENPLTFSETQPIKNIEKIKRIATLGRIYFGQKGQDLIPQIAHEIPDVQFEIYGEGPHKKELLKISCAEKNVEVKTWIPREKVEEKLSKDFDLLLITSHFESGPIVLFEAFQCGIPVLVQEEDYIKEYHLPHWMVFKKNDALDAVDKIQNLKTNFNAFEFEKCRMRLFKNRTTQAFKENVIDIFEKILRGNNE